MRLTYFLGFILLMGFTLCTNPLSAQLLYNQSDNGLHLQSGADLYIEGGVEMADGGAGDAYFTNSGNIYVGYNQSNHFSTLAGTNWTNNNAVNDGMWNNRLGIVYMYNPNGTNDANNALIDGSAPEARFNILVLGGVDPNNGNAFIYSTLRTLEQRLPVEVDEILALRNNEYDLTAFNLRLIDRAAIYNATLPADGDELEGAESTFANDFGWINTHENGAFVIWETSGSGPGSAPFLFPLGSDDTSKSGDLHYFPVSINASSENYGARLDNHDARVELPGPHLLSGTIRDVEQEFYHQVYVEGSSAVTADVTFFVDYKNSPLATNCLDPGVDFNYGRYNNLQWSEENFSYAVEHTGAPGDLQAYTLSGLSLLPILTNDINFTLVVKESAPINCSVLPVELMHIAATPMHNQYIALNWTTGSELNSHYFDIERSMDGVNFEKVGQVDASGNTTTHTSYTYDDFNVQKNFMYYYRLKEVDYDLTYKHSTIVNAKLNNENEWLTNIYPNPVISHNPILNIQSTNDKIIKVEIHNSIGQIVFQTELAILNGNNSNELPFHQLSKGAYHVTISSKEATQTIKVINLRQ